MCYDNPPKLELDLQRTINSLLTAVVFGNGSHFFSLVRHMGVWCLKDALADLNSQYQSFETAWRDAVQHGQRNFFIYFLFYGNYLVPDFRSKRSQPQLNIDEEVALALSLSMHVFPDVGPSVSIDISSDDENGGVLATAAAATNSRTEYATCIACTEQRAVHFTNPCGHPLFCSACRNSQNCVDFLAKPSVKCPICRMSITNTLQIYA
jgi:hypothetical protein